MSQHVFYSLYAFTRNMELHVSLSPFTPKICNRKVHPHNSHYNAVIKQPLLTNQMPALSAHQPINIGIAHVVWPQPTNKRNRRSHNRLASAPCACLWILDSLSLIY